MAPSSLRHTPPMEKQVWFRNPLLYVMECEELHTYNMVWDMQFLAKKKLKVQSYVEKYLNPGADYRLLLVANKRTLEITPDTEQLKPKAVYPTWLYGNPFGELLDMLEHNPGDDPDACTDPYLEPDDRPRPGQEHRVIISDLPNTQSGRGRGFMKILRELNEEYPNVYIHIHGLYAWKYMFGSGYRSVDMDPYTLAKKGRVHLPMGKKVTYEAAPRFAQWVNLLGYSCPDLKVPRNRCMFNMKAALWAMEHYDEDFSFKSVVTKDQIINTHAPVVAPVLTTKGQIITSAVKPLEGDKFACDVCSLANRCKSYRYNAVCSLPKSEALELSSMFRTRDSKEIIDQLGILLDKQVERFERGLKDETQYGDPNNDEGVLDPAVTALGKVIFDQGDKLAKLVDPELRTSAGRPVNVGINVNGGGASITDSSPQKMIAGLVAAIEARGIPRDQITQEMIMAEMTGQALAIEARSSEQ